MKVNRLSKRWQFVALAAFWSCAGGLFAYYYFVRATLGSNPTDPGLWVLLGAMVWVYWAPASLVIKRLTARYPLDAENRWINGLYHVIFSLIIAFVHVLWVVGVSPWPDALFSQTDVAAYFHSINWGEQILSLRGPVDITLYWSILLGISALSYYRRYLERDLQASRLETQLAESKLDVLRLHIQPHFLFNTLHSIVALIQKDNREAAIKMAVQLGELLRGVLKGADEHETLLSDEIAFLNKYLEIERVRFEDRLTINVNVSEEANGAYVPVLILQPLVENALRHGVAVRTGACSLDIISRREENFLCTDIIEKGSALSGESRVSGQGVGLEITKQRLKYMYGQEWEFTLDTAGERGSHARLKIPYYTQPHFKREAGV